MKILVMGGTGNVGGAVFKERLKRKTNVRVLARKRPSERSRREFPTRAGGLWSSVWLRCGCGVALAQNPELGRVERNGNEATLIVEGLRPVDSAASTLASEFGIRLNVEDPAYIFRDDVKDVTANVARSARILRPVLIPMGGKLEVHFILGQPAGSGLLAPTLRSTTLRLVLH